ncbi:MAG: HAD-IC family P-type ATPase [Acidimicrobiia bacterium]
MDHANGLTAAEVAERVARGAVNVADDNTSRTFGQIVRANVFTRFNAILGAMFALIVVTGEWKDALFGVVLVVNTAIGIVQETRAKRTLDRLAVLSAPLAHARRDGRITEIDVDDIVLDDVLELRTGDQVPVDGTVIETHGMEIDESLLTGESDPIAKQPGDEVMSGSIVVAGHGLVVATAVGNEAYARKLGAEARRFTVTRSELVEGINRILGFITWALVPAAVLLGFSQWRSSHDWREAAAGMVAGVVGMVPEGLVLMTSLAFALATVTLGRRNVLVQELPAVEGLARVDVVCLDKTGTLTEGTITFDSFDAAEGVNDDDVNDALGALADDPNRNGTLAAIAEAFEPPSPGWERDDAVAFSSARKWSAASFAGHGSFVLGAPEIVLPDWKVDTTKGRTVVLATTDSPLRGEQLPERLQPLAVVRLAEQIRPDAAETLAYFGAQAVELRVISGDNQETVATIAKAVGLGLGEGGAIDARTLPDDRDGLADALERHHVLGRVTPQQKRDIVGALKSRDHVVAMTGDGVNDALALKDADIGIAMGSGAPATRAVAQLVLLDGKFATLPGVVAEGRRVIANIERVATLFLTKTVYATLLAFTVGLTAVPFPFLPRHLTLVSSLTIGIPAFFLALAPNARRYRPGFVQRVLYTSVPGGIVAAAATYGAYAASGAEGADLAESRTVATTVLWAIGTWVLITIARPLTRLRILLITSLIAAFVAVMAIPAGRDFEEFQLPPIERWLSAAFIALAAIAVLEAGRRILRIRQIRRRRGGPDDAD